MNKPVVIIHFFEAVLSRYLRTDLKGFLCYRVPHDTSAMPDYTHQ